MYYTRNFSVGLKLSKIKFQNKKLDFSSGPVVKNPPSSAGDMGSISGRTTKVPHATGQLSPQAATKTQGKIQEIYLNRIFQEKDIVLAV